MEAKTKAFAFFLITHHLVHGAGQVRPLLLHLWLDPTASLSRTKNPQISERKSGMCVCVCSLAVMKGLLYVLVNIYVMLFPSLSKSRGERFLWYVAHGGVWADIEL